MSELTKEEIAKLGVMVEWADANARRVYIGGQFVGFALRMTNGGWGAFDRNEKRLNGTPFRSPLQVGKWFLAEVQAGRASLANGDEGK